MSLLVVAFVASITLIMGGLAASATTPASRAPSVTIKNFSFKPSPLRIKAGTKIHITNRDGTTHTFTADHGAFDAGKIAPGNSASVTIAKPGTYAYHCEIHDYMKGTIKAT